MPDELKGVFWDMDRDWIIHVYDDSMFIYTLDEKMEKVI